MAATKTKESFFWAWNRFWKTFQIGYLHAKQAPTIKSDVVRMEFNDPVTPVHVVSIDLPNTNHEYYFNGWLDSSNLPLCFPFNHYSSGVSWSQFQILPNPTSVFWSENTHSSWLLWLGKCLASQFTSHTVLFFIFRSWYLCFYCHGVRTLPERTLVGVGVIKVCEVFWDKKTEVWFGRSRNSCSQDQDTLDE